jgi:hypothetical protein
MKKGRNKRVSGRVRLERRLEQQAGNRRKLLNKLDRKTRDYAIQEFAKLGLYQ